MMVSYHLVCALVLSFFHGEVAGRYVTEMIHPDYDRVANASASLSFWDRNETERVGARGIDILSDSINLDRITNHKAAKEETMANATTTWCDNVSSFYCTASQSCYTGVDGYIGCCSESSCLARTCIDYTSGYSPSCDYSTGGCHYCNVASPYCATFTNIVASQHVNACRASRVYSVLSYVNAITTGSIAPYPSSSGPLPAPIASPTPSRTTLTRLSTTRSTSASPGRTSSLTDTTAPITSTSTPAETITSDPALTPPPRTTSKPATTSDIASAVAAQQVAPTAVVFSRAAIAGMVVGIAVAIVSLLLLGYCLKRPFARWRASFLQRKAANSPEFSSEGRGANYYGRADSIEETEKGAAGLAVSATSQDDWEQQQGAKIQISSSQHCLNPQVHTPQHSPTIPPLRSPAIPPQHSPTIPPRAMSVSPVSPIPGLAEAPADFPDRPVSPLSEASESPIDRYLQTSPTSVYTVSPTRYSLHSPTRHSLQSPTNHSMQPPPMFDLSSTSSTPEPEDQKQDHQMPEPRISRPQSAQPPALTHDTEHNDKIDNDRRGESWSPYYRGSKSNVAAPWTYLSAERALGGGWKDSEKGASSDADSERSKRKSGFDSMGP